MAKRKPLTATAGEVRELSREDTARLVPSSALLQFERAMLSSRKRPQKVPAKKRPNRAIEAILEMAEDQLRSGLMTQAEHDKIILRHSGPQAPTPKKAPAKKVPNRVKEAILEMADGQLKSGLITQAEHDMITIRLSRPPAPVAVKPSSAEVKGTRIRKKL
jgi:hypothetical protein